MYTYFLSTLSREYMFLPPSFAWLACVCVCVCVEDLVCPGKTSLNFCFFYTCLQICNRHNFFGSVSNEGRSSREAALSLVILEILLKCMWRKFSWLAQMKKTEPIFISFKRLLTLIFLLIFLNLLFWRIQLTSYVIQ